MCDYSAEFYKQQMYDRSIAGLSNEIWKANLSMKDRTKNTYIQIQEYALQYEEHKHGAEKLRHGNSADSESVSARATTVGNVATFSKSRRGKGNKYYKNKQNYSQNSTDMCYRCQKGRHNPKDCWHKNSKCDKCNKIGHLTRAHRDPASWQHSGQKGGNYTKPKNYSNYKNDKKQVHLVKEESDEYSSEEDTIYVNTCHTATKSPRKGNNTVRKGGKVRKFMKYSKKVKSVSTKPYFKPSPVHNKPYFMEIKCENENFKFEMDSGSGVTLMPYKLYLEKLSHIPLSETKLRAETLKGTMNVVGQININVEYKGKIKSLTLYIYDDEAEHLIAGRPWLEEFQPPAPWLLSRKRSKVHQVFGKNFAACIKKLKKKYNKLFNGKPGHLKGVKVHVEVNEDCPKNTSKPKRNITL